MKRSLVAFAVISTALSSSVAHADGVTVTRGQFTPSLTRNAPSGPLEASATSVLYWFEFRNDGAPGQVTLTWTIDGRAGPRQTLGVVHGRASAWSRFPRRAAGHRFDVTIVDAAGATLHTDNVDLH